MTKHAAVNQTRACHKREKTSAKTSAKTSFSRRNQFIHGNLFPCGQFHMQCAISETQSAADYYYRRRCILFLSLSPVVEHNKWLARHRAKGINRHSFLNHAHRNSVLSGVCSRAYHRRRYVHSAYTCPSPYTFARTGESVRVGVRHGPATWYFLGPLTEPGPVTWT